VAADVEQEAICPYRGLDAFREEDSAFFFGRGSVQTAQSANWSVRCGSTRSRWFGSGKSSLV
jgi:hypothetical protein